MFICFLSVSTWLLCYSLITIGPVKQPTLFNQVADFWKKKEMPPYRFIVASSGGHRVQKRSVSENQVLSMSMKWRENIEASVSIRFRSGSFRSQCQRSTPPPIANWFILLNRFIFFSDKPANEVRITLEIVFWWLTPTCSPLTEFYLISARSRCSSLPSQIRPIHLLEGEICVVMLIVSIQR